MKTTTKVGMALSLAVIALCLYSGEVSAKKKYLTYEQFGAKGDGVTNDFAAIIRTHDEANAKHLPVKAKSGSTYLIGDGKGPAVIRTDVDFGDARFIIDDREVKNVFGHIFRVESYRESYKVQGVETLKAGQKELGVNLPERSLLVVMNNTKKVYIRYGLNQNNGSELRDVLVADKNGVIEDGSLPVWDFDKITSITAYPIDEEVLNITGGIFTTIANHESEKTHYYTRNIEIARSNVHLSGLRHYLEGEGEKGAPYAGFLFVKNAADVVISDCTITPHKTYIKIGAAGKPVSMGTYEIQGATAVNMLVKNVVSSRDISDRTYWGAYASNFCKNLQMEDCVLSRFDAHQGVYNVSVKRCTFGHQGVQLVGWGTLTIEDCTILNNNLMRLRDDYGSTWHGNLIVRNTTLAPVGVNKRGICLINGHNNGKHDFGYDCGLPENIDIDGLLIDDSVYANTPSYKGAYLFEDFGRKAQTEGLQPFRVGGKVTLRNVRTTSGKQILLAPNPEFYSSYTIEQK